MITPFLTCVLERMVILVHLFPVPQPPLLTLPWWRGEEQLVSYILVPYFSHLPGSGWEGGGATDFLPPSFLLFTHTEIWRCERGGAADFLSPSLLLFTPSWPWRCEVGGAADPHINESGHWHLITNCSLTSVLATFPTEVSAVGVYQPTSGKRDLSGQYQYQLLLMGNQFTGFNL